VQTRIRLVAPLISARASCRFGSKRRGPTLWACEIVRPTTGFLPQISHTFAISSSSSLGGLGMTLSAVRRVGFRTDSPAAARRKLQIVVDGYGMINEDGVCAGLGVARLRWSRRAMTVR